MPEFDIQSFKSNFEGGAKSYLFYYYPTIPGTVLGEKVSYLVKATKLPGETIEEQKVAWQGHDFKFAGKHTFEDWTITFNVDPDAKIIMEFQNWIRRKIHDPVSNKYGAISDYMMNQTLHLLGYNGKPVLEYTLFNAWPKSTTGADLAYDSTETATFEVNFSFTHFTTVQNDNQTM